MMWMEKNGSVSPELLSLVKHAGDLVFLKNLDFQYIAASEAFATICAHCRSEEELIGKTDFDLFPRELAEGRYRRDDETLVASGEDWMEFREDFCDRTGKVHPCYTAKYLLRDAAGKPVAILGQYHRVSTEMKEELAEKGRILQKSSKALMRTFFVSNYVDLRTHTYRNLYVVDYAQSLMTPGESAEEGFASFIRTLVRPEYASQVREFCDLSTLEERLRGKSQVDCVYLSQVAIGWCRAMFFPTEWDAEGNLTHVLFTVTAVDEQQVKVIEEGISNKRNLENIINTMPGGIVLYEWDGEDFHVLRMSKYYRELFGYSTKTDANLQDFRRIHPEDREKYRQAIAEALRTTKKLTYEFRVWNPEQGRYFWTQIHAVVVPQENGTSLVYAVYTDITEQKDIELELEKQQDSLELALAVSNQLCCEYDPESHTVTSFTKDNFFHFPQVLQNYPECLREMDFIHPEERSLFIRTLSQAEEEEKETHCDVRARREGEYRWFSCYFRPYYDPVKEHQIIMLTILDATVRINSIRDYENRIQSLLSTKKNTLSMCSINLSRDTFLIVDHENHRRLPVRGTDSFEALIMAATERIVNDEVRSHYRRIFSRESLLQRAREGKMHTEMEFLARLAPGHYEWVTAVVELIHNPITNELGGIAYSKSTQEWHMSQELLHRTLQQDYLLSSIIMTDTDEFYMYEADRRKFEAVRKDFWNSALKFPQPGISKDTWDYLSSMFEKQRMLRKLDRDGVFSYAYDGVFQGQQRRMEISFSYLDSDRRMILAAIRDITDRRLQEQWKYESEHDDLTRLYNRKTVFTHCRRLLTEHPEDSFLMIHCDVRRFHLYNTFFGEKAGDRLLRRMAEVIRSMAAEYPYAAFGRIESDVFCLFLPFRKELVEKQIHLCFEAVTEFSPEFPLRLSLGVYAVTDSTMPIEAMFSRATIASKSEEKNFFGLVAQFDEPMEQDLKNEQEITRNMKAAVSEEQFEVYLQPKYALDSGKMVGAEALVRWNHPTRGRMMPGSFIPIFEQNGFIAELDRYMWEHVCRILRRWKEEGNPICPISVNLSRVSMYNPATVSVLKGLVEKYRLEPSDLELELTETAYMDDPEELKRMLLDLQHYGFKILMDDFGSGYSSLNTLRELPVDMLKLDMKFLLNLQNDARGLAVLSSVVRMSKMLHLSMIAEGVERQEQAEYLQEIGCEYVQGYLFAKPMTVADFEDLYEGENRARGDQKSH